VLRLATGEIISFLLVLLLTLLERSGGLLLEFLLEFLFLWLGMILLHHMCARIFLTDLLALNILCPCLVLNIKGPNKLNSAKLLSLVFQGSCKVSSILWQLSNDTACHKLVRKYTPKQLKFLHQCLYFMILFDYWMALNPPIVMELLHDVQLRTGIRNAVTGLKCIPHGLTSRKVHICINKGVSYDAQQSCLTSVVSMLKSMLLLRGLWTNSSFMHHMKAIHRSQPQDAFLAPPLVVSALKRHWFEQARKSQPMKIA
jgi:hypothetical protein